MGNKRKAAKQNVAVDDDDGPADDLLDAESEAALQAELDASDSEADALAAGGEGDEESDANALSAGSGGGESEDDDFDPNEVLAVKELEEKRLISILENPNSTEEEKAAAKAAATAKFVALGFNPMALRPKKNNKVWSMQLTRFVRSESDGN